MPKLGSGRVYVPVANVACHSVLRTNELSTLNRTLNAYYEVREAGLKRLCMCLRRGEH